MVEQREMTCILCPMGCRLSVSMDEKSQVSVSGNGCKRGIAYGEQELINPMRVVTGSVRVSGGEWPLCPVKTKGMVPKSKIGDVLEAMRKARLEAPVAIGQTVVANICGTGVDLVATAPRIGK